MSFSLGLAHLHSDTDVYMNGAKHIFHKYKGVLQMFLKGYPLEAKNAPKN